MKLVADEHISGMLVRWLRSLDHEVLWIAEQYPSVSDARVAELARASDGVLISRDLGFSQRWFRERQVLPGLIVLRLGDPALKEELAMFQRAWPQIESACGGSIVVIQPRQVRVRSMRSK